MTRAERVLAWVANLLVPGTGLVLAGRMALGVLTAVAWGLLAAALLVVCLVAPEEGAPRMAPLFAAAVVLQYGAVQLLLAARLRRMRALLASEARDAPFRSALGAYARGRLDEARATCKDLLRADPDDVEATLLLASIARRRGDARAARRHLRRARYLDDAGRWDFEIERELAAIGPSRPPGAR